jgi:pimeloyl-ACP methyl ester carboxylesterase
MTQLPSSTSTNESVVSFAKKPQVRVLRGLITVFARLMPKATARFCVHLFLTPGRQRPPAWEAALIRGAETSLITVMNKQVKLYAWAGGANAVLLCHGWGGRASQMSMFVQPLLEAGCSVLAFDAPGHGDSAGSRTDMVEYSAALAQVLASRPDVFACVGHSFGAGNILYGRQVHGYRLRKVVMLACFHHGEWVIDQFGAIFNVPLPVVQMMKDEHAKDRQYAMRWADFDIVTMAQEDDTPILLVHDRDDKEIPFEHSQRFMDTQVSHISLLATEGLGHRRILRDAKVIQTVRDFLLK